MLRSSAAVPRQNRCAFACAQARDADRNIMPCCDPHGRSGGGDSSRDPGSGHSSEKCRRAACQAAVSLPLCLYFMHPIPSLCCAHALWFMCARVSLEQKDLGPDTGIGFCWINSATHNYLGQFEYFYVVRAESTGCKRGWGCCGRTTKGSGDWSRWMGSRIGARVVCRKGSREASLRRA